MTINNSSKIPYDFHIKRMWKSRDPMDFLKHLEGFFQQHAIQASFSLQKEMNDAFDFSRKLMAV